MRVKAIVEVTSGPGDRLPAELLAAAYRASRSGLVALVLNAVPRTAVDALLDPVVRETGDVHGVRYLDIGSDESALDGATAATVVVAASDGFRQQCAERGVACIGVTAALPLLGELATRPLPHDVGFLPAASPSRATAGRWASSFLRLGGAADTSATSAA